MCTLAGQVKLTRYAPGLRQFSHEHEGAHMSLVLAGGFDEETGRAEISFSAGRVALRPDGMRHAGTFSRAGALILSCSFPAQAPDITTPHWSAPLPRARLRVLTPLLRASNDEASEAAWDLLALTNAEADRAPPSPWLLSARDELMEEPSTSVTAIAARAGRHRVHLARAFLAAFGETPSVFRRRAMLDRALCAMTRGAPPAAAAAEAGFVDQSHLSRACRDAFGLAPGQLVRGAADVASVQYAPS
jgi:AraC family transcriptional regulator